MRACLADDLDSPGALAAVDTWATNVAAGEPASDLVVRAVDALLGVQL
jgi:L-cysteine:1D-myo-inositol 2-amino-2-deoxy-alpha-D-glucopyranoside ligase